MSPLYTYQVSRLLTEDEQDILTIKASKINCDISFELYGETTFVYVLKKDGEA